MARRIEDLILALPVIAGVDWRDPAVVPMPAGDPRKVDLKRLRVAFYTKNGILSPTRETVEVVSTAAKVLSEGSMMVEETRPESIEQTYEIFLGLIGADNGAGVEKLIKKYGTKQTHPLLRRFVDLARPYARTTADFVEFLGQLG